MWHGSSTFIMTEFWQSQMLAPHDIFWWTPWERNFRFFNWEPRGWECVNVHFFQVEGRVYCLTDVQMEFITQNVFRHVNLRIDKCFDRQAWKCMKLAKIALCFANSWFLLFMNTRHARGHHWSANDSLIILSSLCTPKAETIAPISPFLLLYEPFTHTNLPSYESVVLFKTY